MQTKRQDLFTTIHTEGAILPADLLQRVAEGDTGLEGLRPEDYHLSGEKLNEAVNRAWNRLLGAWKAFHTAREKLAERHRGTRHSDLYHGLILVMQKLGSDDGCPELGLPGLGSFLWSKEAIADLVGCHIANTDLLAAIRELAFTVDGNVLRAVDYKNLGAEELGSIYESLLELHPQINQDAGTFELGTAAGHERKTTGSYYTPTSLINCLLDSALDPVVDEAVKGEPSPSGRGQGEGRWPADSTAEQQILSLKICDPACGSGHFLIAAAHRIGKRLAAVRTGDDEPGPPPEGLPDWPPGEPKPATWPEHIHPPKQTGSKETLG